MCLKSVEPTKLGTVLPRQGRAYNLGTVLPRQGRAYNSVLTALCAPGILHRCGWNVPGTQDRSSTQKQTLHQDHREHSPNTA